MHLMIVDEYPSGAVAGCDFFTRSARGEIIEHGPDGPVTRMERVVITDRYVDMDDPIVGQICVGERTVRHLAHEFGLVDGWRVKDIADDNHSLRAELVELSLRCAKQQRAIEFLEQAGRAPAETLYLSLDGTEHASRRACSEATAKFMGIETRMIADAVPVPLSEPAPAPEASRP